VILKAESWLISGKILIKSREKKLAVLIEDIKIAYPDRVQNIGEGH